MTAKELSEKTPVPIKTALAIGAAIGFVLLMNYRVDATEKRNDQQDRVIDELVKTQVELRGLINILKDREERK